MTAAYPLLWPEGHPRHAPAQRKPGKFHRTERVYSSGGAYNRKIDMTIAAALARLQDELDRIHARYVVVSSSVDLRLDGLPRSGAREPDDPAVAVYFQLDGRPHCLPCDTYTTVAANIAAVAALDRAREDGWRTMDSAPKDGALILAFEPITKWMVVVEYTNDETWPWREASSAQEFLPGDLTHWRPIPAPPTTEGA